MTDTSLQVYQPSQLTPIAGASIDNLADLFLIYDADSGTSPKLKSLTPAQLVLWLDRFIAAVAPLSVTVDSGTLRFEIDTSALVATTAPDVPVGDSSQKIANTKHVFDSIADAARVPLKREFLAFFRAPQHVIATTNVGIKLPFDTVEVGAALWDSVQNQLTFATAGDYLFELSTLFTVQRVTPAWMVGGTRVKITRGAATIYEAIHGYVYSYGTSGIVFINASASVYLTDIRAGDVLTVYTITDYVEAYVINPPGWTFRDGNRISLSRIHARA